MMKRDFAFFDLQITLPLPRLILPALICCSVHFCSGVYAQDPRDHARTQEYLQQQEQMRKTAVLREYDSAVFYSDHGEHERADAKYRYVLANIKSVPSDLTFHFGRNSFYLKKYKQSIDWLNKYIQLKGTNGQFSDEAAEIKLKAEQEFIREKSQDQEKIQAILSNDFNIDCGPSGVVTCPVCKGQHVIIRKGRFGNEYRTCGYCNAQGILTCEEYNQLLRGQLKPKG